MRIISHPSKRAFSQPEHDATLLLEGRHVLVWALSLACHMPTLCLLLRVDRNLEPFDATTARPSCHGPQASTTQARLASHRVCVCTRILPSNSNPRPHSPPSPTTSLPQGLRHPCCFDCQGASVCAGDVVVRGCQRNKRVVDQGAKENNGTIRACRIRPLFRLGASTRPSPYAPGPLWQATLPPSRASKARSRSAERSHVRIFAWALLFQRDGFFVGRTPAAPRRFENFHAQLAS